MDRSDWGEDDAEPFRPPLPPEDRVWRHPSELGLGVGAGLVPPAPAASRRRGSMALAVVAAGLVLVAGTGAAVRYLAESPSSAERRPLATEVSVVATSAGPGLRSAADGRLRITASLPGGKERTSRAVIVDERTVVTTMSAVAGATTLAAVLPDGRRFAAAVLGDDDESGLAVLGVDGIALTPDATGSVVPLEIGDEVWMAGSATAGEITGLGRHTASPAGARLHHVMRLDIDERKAEEGQALVDAAGAVVGLCTRDARGDVVGIPIDLATSAARSLRRNARLVLPWIGVSGRDAEADPTHPDGGALLSGVTPSGPAATAGLAPGDVVVDLGATPVHSMSALVLAARAYDAGDTVPVRFVRGGQVTTVAVVLGELAS